jgi:hypothetical protein
VHELQKTPGVNSVDSRAPTLEEIFVAYMQSEPTAKCDPHSELDTVTTT